MFIHYDVPRGWGKTNMVIRKLELEEKSYCLTPNKPLKDLIIDSADYNIRDRVFSINELYKLISKIKKEGIHTLYIDEFESLEPNKALVYSLKSNDELMELLIESGVDTIETYSTSIPVKNAQRRALEITGKYLNKMSNIVETIENQ